jgi:rubredoxin---NAD+ reductase
MTQNIVIIGSGLSGYMFAKELRKADSESKLTIITQSPGHFYSKPQLSTALTLKKSAESLSMGNPEKMSAQLNATIINNTTVTSINTDEKTIATKNNTIEYDTLVLALGADTLRPPLAGDALSDIMSVNHLYEYHQFRDWITDKKQLVILGSGLVGCEFCNDLINADYNITMISLDEYPLMRLVPREIGLALQKAFESNGVRCHFNTAATSVLKNEPGYTVTTNNNNEITTDGVLSAVGLRPHIQLAKAAGLAINQGIVVNNLLQTSDPNIYALGDCAEVAGQVKQYVAPLLLCARSLAKTISGEDKTVHYPIMPIVIKTPILPITACPPTQGAKGEWKIEQSGQDIKALFMSESGILNGFALSGRCVTEKNALVKKMMPLP